MARKQTFKVWLKQQSKRDDPVGDLAQDVQHDSGLPNDNADVAQWRRHFEDRRACDDAMHALEEAWEEYVLAQVQSIA